MKFLRKHKKLIIALSVIVALLITLIVLMFTLFSLKSVEIEFETGNKIIMNEKQSQIISEIDLGGTVFFKNKDEMTSKIEKKYPYVKVINIETILPNKFIIHIAERQEIYAISSLNRTCYLDNELKVLRIEEESFVSTNTNAIKLDLFGLDFDLSAFSEGKFFDVSELTINSSNKTINLGEQTQETLNNLLNCFQINNRTLVDLKALAKSITFSTYIDYRNGETALQAKIVDFNDFEIFILCPCENLEDKVSNMLYAYEKIMLESPEKLNTHKMTVYTNKKGENLVIIEQKS